MFVSYLFKFFYLRNLIYFCLVLCKGKGWRTMQCWHEGQPSGSKLVPKFKWLWGSEWSLSTHSIKSPITATIWSLESLDSSPGSIVAGYWLKLWLRVPTNSCPVNSSSKQLNVCCEGKWKEIVFGSIWLQLVSQNWVVLACNQLFVMLVL